MARLYTLKRNINDILKNRKGTIDLYLCLEETKINGPTLIIPTISIKLKETNKLFTFKINMDNFKKEFDDEPASQTTTYVPFTPNLINVDDFSKFKDDVYWSKNLTPSILKEELGYLAKLFINKEMGIILDEDRVIDVSVVYDDEWNILHFKYELLIDKHDFESMVNKVPRKFVNELNALFDARDGDIIDFIDLPVDYCLSEDTVNYIKRNIGKGTST